MVKCTEETCKEEAVRLRYRGKEEIYYCERHAEWWDQLMENLQ